MMKVLRAFLILWLALVVGYVAVNVYYYYNPTKEFIGHGTLAVKKYHHCPGMGIRYIDGKCQSVYSVQQGK